MGVSLPAPLSSADADPDLHRIAAALSEWLPDSADRTWSLLRKDGHLHESTRCGGSVELDWVASGPGELEAVTLRELVHSPDLCLACRRQLRPGGFLAQWFRREYGPLLAAWQARGRPAEEMGRVAVGLAPTGTLTLGEVSAITSCLLRGQPPARFPVCDDWAGPWLLARQGTTHGAVISAALAEMLATSQVLGLGCLVAPLTDPSVPLPDFVQVLAPITAGSAAAVLDAAHVLLCDAGVLLAWQDAAVLWQAALALEAFPSPA